MLPVTATLPLASRCMKARRHGQCGLCGLGITVGQLIAKSAGAWYHATCLIKERQAAATGTEPPCQT